KASVASAAKASAASAAKASAASAVKASAASAGKAHPAASAAKASAASAAKAATPAAGVSRPAPIPSRPAWSRGLRLCGVTGTNGKTSTTFYLAAMLGTPSAPAGYTTTLGTYLGERRLDLPHSYSGMLDGMRACLAHGGRHVVLE